MRPERRCRRRRRLVLRCCGCGWHGCSGDGEGAALRATGKFGALLEPCLVILRRIDHERPFHSVMAETAKLSANHFSSRF